MLTGELFTTDDTDSGQDIFRVISREHLTTNVIRVRIYEHLISNCKKITDVDVDFVTIKSSLASQYQRLRTNTESGYLDRSHFVAVLTSFTLKYQTNNNVKCKIKYQISVTRWPNSKTRCARGVPTKQTIEYSSRTR